MEGVIVDPRTGVAMEVDKFFRAQTFATSRPQESHASILGQSFIFSTIEQAETLSFLATETGIIIAIKNNNNELKLRVQLVEISADVAGGIYVLTKNPVFGTVITNAVPHTGNNLNFDSSKPSNIIGHVWDETGGAGITGITGGTDIAPHTVNLTKDDLFNSSILLSPGNSIAVKYTAPAGSAAEFSCNIRAFLEGVS